MKNVENLYLLKRAVHFLKPFRKNIAFIFICILLSSALNLIQPLISRVIIDNGLVNKNLY